MLFKLLGIVTLVILVLDEKAHSRIPVTGFPAYIGGIMISVSLQVPKPDTVYSVPSEDRV